MEIKVRRKGNIIILDLSGRIDVNAANFIETVGFCLHDGYRNILCNFEEVEFIDYMGISVMAIAYKEVLNHKGIIRFANMPAHLKGLFSISGLDRVIDIYATEELGLNSFQEDKIIDEIKKLHLRRRFRRLPLDIKVELKDKYALSPQCLQVEVLNLSGVGAYIYGCDKFKLGDEVILTLRLPPNSEEIILGGRVVWLSDKHIQPQLHPGMGVEFSNLSGQIQEKLLEFVERNLSFRSTED